MTFPDQLQIEDFNYSLPSERIAQLPLPDRDSSKLLIIKHGEIRESIFREIDKELPGNCNLVFNDTKVIRARLIFTKNTGATIEVFCLEPVHPTAEIQRAFQQIESCTWSCLVGNAKRWKKGTLKKEIEVNEEKFILNAEKGEDTGDGHFLVRFFWEPRQLTFSEILEVSGRIPLPPYINRGDTPVDTLRYQTIFAKHEGSVAAPTAGLHFTDEVMKKLQKKSILFEKIALHVGVGTFRPVSAPKITEHVMHQEKIIVSKNTLKNLIQHMDQPVIATGTTTVRTLESLYWVGVKILAGGGEDSLDIGQWDPYNQNLPGDYSTLDALTALYNHLERKEQKEYSGNTELMIVPGYRFRIVGGMITNFHMPQSTLLLLVAAFIGDAWKDAYEFALNNGFRFLSYGDSCLFFPAEGTFCIK